MDLEQISKLLAEQLNIKPEQVKRESRIVEDLGADSLDVVELLMTLEDECGVSISDEEALKTKTVGDILELVSKKTETNKK